MKLHFDSSQQYQLDAIASITDLFRGNSKGYQREEFLSTGASSTNTQLFGTDMIVRNVLSLGTDDILVNMGEVQKRNTVPDTTQISEYGMNLSIEMETGTGKTYVYLRTIHALHEAYGWTKFIIVVPSVAIREGVLKNLEITREHFDSLYEKPARDFYVYDPKRRGQSKFFATTATLQIMVITIDSFSKGFEEAQDGKKKKKGGNIIYQESDWGVPIEFIRSTNPVVILDEPQNMETDIRKKAIENLNPLAILRYSATHKNPYHLLYRLGPVEAYEMGLVKKIEVDSIRSDDAYNDAYMVLEKVEAKGRNVVAKITIDKSDDYGLQKQSVSAKVGDSLFDLSGGREVYQGYTVDEIDIGTGYVGFSNSKSVRLGETKGGLGDEMMKFQMEQTIRYHFEREKTLAPRGIKVLTLFFIDQVANYRKYLENSVEQGKFAVWFEEIYAKMNAKYGNLLPYEVSKVHNGYFSQDKKSVTPFEERESKTKEGAENTTYELIMRDKERLLDPNEPLRFIFSHSALREGWDNPNVFQICTLNETKSDMKKRQEIGRGLRLPVDKDGNRIWDPNINILTVIPNESYEDFAANLQKEYEDEGIAFTRSLIKNARNKRKVTLKKGYDLDPNFQAIWDKISKKTRYSVDYEPEILISRTALRLRTEEIRGAKIESTRVSLGMGVDGITTTFRSQRFERLDSTAIVIPDVVTAIQSKTKLTKETIVRIIRESESFQKILTNPELFIDRAISIISEVLEELMIDGIKYEKTGETWDMKRFENEELEAYLENVVEVHNQDKTLYDHIIVDSETIERPFAMNLEGMDDVKFYFKLPSWFKIPTPIGSYNPDWAIVFENDKRIYFVAETKGTTDIEALSRDERYKILCGKSHFSELEEVNFKGPIRSTMELVME